MGPNLIALAIPFFFLFIGLELAVARARRRAVYRFTDAVADLGCGVTQRVSLLFFEWLLVALYVVIYNHARLIDLGRHPVATWVFAFVAVDFIYYWWHRASHRVNILWAAHVVHHQSEDYNLAVALRQAVLTPVTGLVFALPLAVLGVPPLVWVATEALNTLYQFWIHTELVGKLGAVEQVMNTPSHHRVHHARNPGYLDRNYAAVFIIWDRLFGTYAPEVERPTYGITKPLRSFNSIWAQVQPVVELLKIAGKAPTLRDKLRVLLAPPERKFPWHVDAPSDGAKYDVEISRGMRVYVGVNFAIAVVGTFLLMLFSTRLPWAALTAGGLLVLLTMFTAGGLMEAKRWARKLEPARLAMAGVAVVWLIAR
jgi:sterol desaturase/sphingolipid hydroxylase (fatty acid hydroxylase superfamily)